METEELKELKNINHNINLIKDELDYLNIKFDHINMNNEIRVKDKSGHVDFYTYNFLSFNILLIIFGFLVGYFLVKSFFDGYNI